MTEISTDVFAHGLAAGLTASAFLAAIVVLSTEWGGVADALALLASFVIILATVVVGAPMLSDISTAAEDH
jgi:preprotein translocase subunit SecD